MKSTEEIYNEMLTTFRAKTGLEASGSVDLAVRFWAVATEIGALYAQSDWVARQCFPQSATGDCLEKHAQVRGLTRRAASAAVGSIRFLAPASAAAPLTIPKGTVCMTAGLVRFETDNAATIPVGGSQVDVQAHAVEAGSAGNAAPGTILTMAVPPVGVGHCLNPAAFAGGLDEEDDEGLRPRVLETYQRLPNGANAAFYQQGAMSHKGVAAAAVVPRPRGVGTVDVVVSTPEGLPEGALLETLRTYFSTRREIAVEVQVKAPSVQNIALAVQVKPKPNASFVAVKPKVEAALREYFSGKLLGQDILRAKLGELVYGIPGVENYKFTAPGSDVTIGKTVLPKLTALTVTELV
ncbi:MAG: baseplate J/gp47 family protein [Oscillospiraceae bacterium]